MKNLLITGFDPFGGGAINPSWEAVRNLPDQIGDYRLHRRMLPTVYGQGAEALLALAEELRPDVVICVGVAGGREAVTPERIAVNIRDSRGRADNAGNQYAGERIAEDGPAAYFSTLPVEAMAGAIREAGLPGVVSNTAGTYVCNDVMYTALHRYAGTEVRAGFIHVPYLPGQGVPSLPLEQTVKALEAAITCL